MNAGAWGSNSAAGYQLRALPFSRDDDGEIVYGIGAIKGVGEGPIEAIIEARNEGGYFRELFDLCARTDIKNLTAGCWKS